MNVILSKRPISRTRTKAEAMGKSLNQFVRDYLTALVGADDPGRSIREFKKPSGQGHSRGRRFNREEIHGRS